MHLNSPAFLAKKHKKIQDSLGYVQILQLVKEENAEIAILENYNGKVKRTEAYTI